MITAVCFDLDNTLTDRPASVQRYANRFLADFGLALAESSQVEVEQAIVAADGEGYNPQRAVDLRASLRWVDPPSADVLGHHWLTVFPQCTEARPDAIATLHALRRRGIRLGLITNGGVAVQTTKLRSLDLERAFDVTVISEAVGVSKPASEIFQIALDGLGVKPARALFVGDHPINDIRGATDVGMRAVWVACSGSWPPTEPLPPVTVDSIGEVLEIVKAAA